MATATPWGPADSVKRLCPGIMWYGTPSHGGAHVAPSLNTQINSAWRQADGWYEEDCDWAIVAYHFPAAFPGEAAEAILTLKNWHPGAYMRVTGETLTSDESYMLRKHGPGVIIH